MKQRLTASAKFDQHIQKNAHSRIGATTFRPNGRDVVPLHRELGENRDQLLPPHPRSGHETRGHSYTCAPSFLFEPVFEVVDFESDAVNTLGSLDNSVTLTTPEDIGTFNEQQSIQVTTAEQWVRKNLSDI